MDVLLYILKEWYGMPPSVPVVFSFAVFAMLGIYAAVAIDSSKLRLWLMVGLVVLYLACSPVSAYDFLGVGVYSTFLGGTVTLVLAGYVIGHIVRLIKRNIKNRAR